MQDVRREGFLPIGRERRFSMTSLHGLVAALKTPFFLSMPTSIRAQAGKVKTKKLAFLGAQLFWVLVERPHEPNGLTHRQWEGKLYRPITVVTHIELLTV